MKTPDRVDSGPQSDKLRQLIDRQSKPRKPFVRRPESRVPTISNPLWACIGNRVYHGDKPHWRGVVCDHRTRSVSILFIHPNSGKRQVIHIPWDKVRPLRAPVVRRSSDEIRQRKLNKFACFAPRVIELANSLGLSPKEVATLYKE